MKRSFLLFFFVLGVRLLADAQPTPSILKDLPDIALPDVKGDTLRLSSIKGKVVLLDFWASWCGPCRVANKGLGKLYGKYRDKGFEIFSVSFDTDRGNWLKAIRKDKITWLQVNDNGGRAAPTAADWQVSAIPTTMLFDRNGYLVAIDAGGKELEKWLDKLLK